MGSITTYDDLKTKSWYAKSWVWFSTQRLWYRDTGAPESSFPVINESYHRNFLMIRVSCSESLTKLIRLLYCRRFLRVCFYSEGKTLLRNAGQHLYCPTFPAPPSNLESICNELVGVRFLCIASAKFIDIELSLFRLCVALTVYHYEKVGRL